MARRSANVHVTVVTERKRTPGYNQREMSHLFESFDFLDRGWDVRALENQSLRSVFLWLLALVFMIGAGVLQFTYQLFHLHQFDWTHAFLLPVFSLAAFRYARIIYRRLGRSSVTDEKSD